MDDAVSDLEGVGQVVEGGLGVTMWLVSAAVIVTTLKVEPGS